MAAPRARPLWRCPKCGARFVTKNLWHSCGRFSLDDLLARSDPPVRALFRRLAACMRRHCGRRVVLLPQKTRAVFMHEVRFCSVQPRKDHLRLGLVLRRRLAHPRIVRVEDFGHALVNHMRVGSTADLDAELGGWLRESAETYGRRSGRLC